MDKMTKPLARGYEAPLCCSFEIMPEGILCASGPFGISDWEENEDVL